MVLTSPVLGIGTAQFGMSYGIKNPDIPTPNEQVAEILKGATDLGFFFLDTAIDYGMSEAVLGKNDISKFSVISKIPQLPEEHSDLNKYVFDQVNGSLNRLNISFLDGLLLHRPLQLLGKMGPEIYDSLCCLKEEGLVKRIGISVYAPSDIEAILERYEFDIAQIPANPFDRRFETSNLIAELTGQGVSIHIRSIFLQGLLLMSALPKKFLRWSNEWCCWQDWLLESNQSALEACIRHATALSGAEAVIIGINSYSELKQIVAASTLEPKLSPLAIGVLDPELLDPSRWSRL